MKRNLKLLVLGSLLLVGTISSCGGETYSVIEDSLEVYSSSATNTYPQNNEGETTPSSNRPSVDVEVSSSESQPQTSSSSEEVHSSSQDVVDSSSNEHVDSSSENNQSSETIPEVINFSTFSKAKNNSKPTTSSSFTKYTMENLGISLAHNSSLKVEYSNPIKARYDCVYQKLNPAGSSEMISTYKDTYYAKGNSLAQIVNGEIKWTISSEPIVSLLNFNFKEEIFEADYQITSHKFSGDVTNSNITLFLGKMMDISSLHFEMIVDDTFSKVDNVSLSYVDNKGAKVSIITMYDYSYTEVYIPE